MYLVKVFSTLLVVAVCAVSYISSDTNSDSETRNNYTVSDYAFHRSVCAFGYDYFKSVLHIGNCKDIILFTENLVWSFLKLNRIIDIYYKSSNPKVVVTRVEVTLVSYGTNNIAFSSTGVGKSEFIGAVIFTTYQRLTFYKLEIFSCRSNVSTQSHPKTQESGEGSDLTSEPETKNTMANIGLSIYSESETEHSEDAT